MKIHGESLSRLNVETVVFPREGGKDLVFRLQSVLDQDEFEKYCPEPKPPLKTMKGEVVGRPDLKDKKYVEAMNNYGANKVKWLFLKSIDATEGVTWETVDIATPDTWKLIEKELQDSGLNTVEIIKLYGAMMKANSLDDEYLEEARKRFFEREQEKKESEAE